MRNNLGTTLEYHVLTKRKKYVIILLIQLEVPPQGGEGSFNAATQAILKGEN